MHLSSRKPWVKLRSGETTMVDSRTDAEKSLSQYLQLLRREMPNLKETYGVRNLAVFGSYLRQEQKEKSDLDLLVEFDETPTLFQFIRLENHLSDLLEVEVDLVMKDALKPRIGKRVLEEAQEL